MTSEWHEVPLRELVGYISKGIAPSYAEEASETTIRVLNQKCNRNFRISYGDSRLHDTLKKKVPPERYVKPDDILINSTGAGTAGRIAQIEDVPSATTIDGHMILIRSNRKVTQKFLGYALKAHQWEVLQLDEGSTGQTELNRDRLLDEIMINYPVSFDEQNAIVGTLESIVYLVDFKNPASNEFTVANQWVISVFSWLNSIFRVFWINSVSFAFIHSQSCLLPLTAIRKSSA